MKSAPPLYVPLDRVLVRAPVLPVEAYAAWANDPRRALADPLVGSALAVGSPDLLAQAHRVDADPRRERRMRQKLQRYLTRMSTRPTPYGMFAGVALARLGATTDLELADGVRTRMRPDMGWLLAFVSGVESDPAVRRQLRVWANSAVLLGPDRAALSERSPLVSAGDRSASPVTIRATPAVLITLQTSRDPIAWSDLALAVQQAMDATPEQVEALLDRLWAETFLLTELRPPLTHPAPARYVAERLAAIPAAASHHEDLVGLLDGMADWDASSLDTRVSLVAELERRATAAAPDVSGPYAQVDTALPLVGDTLSAQIGEAAARAAELLLRLGVPLEVDPLAAYRHRFLARYGTDRSVGLLELLDPDHGLGPPAATPHPVASGANGSAGSLDRVRRDAVLRRIAAEALRRRQLAVELDPDTLTELAPERPDPGSAPLSVDLSVVVLAESRTEIDAGRFRLLIGPNFGAQAAGRYLGRFADVLGADGFGVLARAAQIQRGHAPGAVHAELVYLPPRTRSANVAVRPDVWGEEIVLGTTPALPADRVIRLDELVVGVNGGRFVVSAPGVADDIRVHAGHMLNSRLAPAVCRFLEDVSRGPRRLFTPFSWGASSDVPFLPRLEADGVVLAPARWRVDASLRDGCLAPDGVDFGAQLARWRSDWNVPARVYLTQADNRLLVDLESEHEVDQLRDELRRIGPGGLTLEEPLPGPEHAWLPGPAGRHICELVVSLVQPAPELVAGDGHRPELATTAHQVPATERIRLPGSDWLYLKLYGPADGEDELLTGALREFARFALGSGLAQRWFFVRYADPDRHLRVRFGGDPGLLLNQLLPAACSLAGELVEAGRLAWFEIGTYDREVERYGGVAAMAVVEEIFSVESQTTVDLLAHSDVDRTELAVLSVDRLLSDLGLEAGRRLDWCRERVADRRPSGMAYRQRSRSLRAALSDSSSNGIGPRSADQLVVLRSRAWQLEPLAARLIEVERRGALTKSYDRLCDSLVHMHLNRLLGVDGPSESLVLGLLLRTREGLAKAPSVRAISGPGP